MKVQKFIHPISDQTRWQKKGILYLNIQTQRLGVLIRLHIVFLVAVRVIIY